MRNRKTIYDGPIYMFVKKHYCPKCANLLKTKKNKSIVNLHSEDAKNLDFSFADSFLIGDVEFTWYVFCCEKCDIEIDRKEMKKYESNKKRSMLR